MASRDASHHRDWPSAATACQPPTHGTGGVPAIGDTVSYHILKGDGEALPAGPLALARPVQSNASACRSCCLPANGAYRPVFRAARRVDSAMPDIAPEFQGQARRFRASIKAAESAWCGAIASVARAALVIRAEASQHACAPSSSHRLKTSGEL